MPKVEFQPSGKSVTAPPGTELLAAAREVHLDIPSSCGGRGTCGKCIVRIIEGDVDSDSLGQLPAESVAEGYVLACKTKILDTPVVVEVPEPAEAGPGRFDEQDDSYMVRQELLPRQWEFDPLAIKWRIQVPPPQPQDGLGDLDRLVRAIQQEWGPRDVACSVSVLRSLADALRQDDGLVTVTLIRDQDRLHLVRVDPGDLTTRSFAVAVDVGTTTVAVQLIGLTAGKILGTRSAYNDQIHCGLDVISRINYARRAGGLEELRTRVLASINGLLGQLCRAHDVAPHEVTNAAVSGNTTMVHLLLGMNPEYIRLEPYTPTLLHVPYLTADQVGIDINPDSWICFSPNVGSYVGGDITAGLLCTELATDTEDVYLFIDVGTNGEVVVGNRDFLLSCACSAGPAFEGGGIDCGMRAAVGAIEKVDVDPRTGKATCQTIGQVRPRGICGSGMIDLLANLFRTGWIDPAGKLDRTRNCPFIRTTGRRARYVIVPADRSDTAKAIEISELDIDNIIRAKAAIYSACSLMLNQVGIGFEDLSGVYIAGGFGRYLDLDNAITLGLIPDLPQDRYRFIGNASLLGSYMVAVSKDYRQRQLALANRMTYFDLSTDPTYMDQYTAALFLPHTDPSRFPSVSQDTDISKT